MGRLARTKEDRAFIYLSHQVLGVIQLSRLASKAPTQSLGVSFALSRRSHACDASACRCRAATHSSSARRRSPPRARATGRPLSSAARTSARPCSGPPGGGTRRRSCSRPWRVGVPTLRRTGRHPHLSAPGHRRSEGRAALAGPHRGRDPRRRARAQRDAHAEVIGRGLGVALGVSCVFSASAANSQAPWI